ncbi:hypothetical protein E5676_scaffold105G00680 [Cucumis melo var. makuwa]|uniref:Retrotransposon gag protein n=1 Tax=Cucumis melo var. makuwa TaxID=1194695 RepID=A0A5D3C8J2_CUCMM|nr:hypothetical protein E6C27_scaffold13G00810 [Cucumis melo var. makuwa]TYK07660.1 hypothetical protein E5676_scaffold105G00680 [Cucumis melo var. makuwa]
MWKPKPIREKDEDFLRPQQSITLTKFLLRSFIDDHPNEVLEVVACHAISIAEVDNSYTSSEEVDNPNEIKQKASVFDRIKSSTTRSSIFQRVINIFISKSDQPSTSAFDSLKMSSDRRKREMKTLKEKPLHEKNNDDKIHSCVPSRMKRKLFVDIIQKVP